MAPSTRRDQLLLAGAWLATARDRAGLTQREFGRLIGKSYQSVSSYERGVSAPDDATCQRIAGALQVSLTTVRKHFGLYVPDDADDTAPVRASVIAAILADPDLPPPAKEHLTGLYGLLRGRGTEPTPTTAELLGRELERQERHETTRRPPTP